MNQGLYGGTFNPLHNGHIKVIKYVKKKFALKKVFVIPSAIPPHKTSINLAPAQDRLNMVKNTLKTIPDLFESEIELSRKGPSFTIDTIKQFKKISDPDIDFYFIMGSDAFFDVHNWKRKDEIFQLVKIIVMTRAGEKTTLNNIKSFINTKISKDYEYNNVYKFFFHKNMKSIHLCKVPKVNISSTQIRDFIKSGVCIKNFVPKAVQEIIKNKGLYF